MARWVYQGCAAIICSRHTSVDLVKLEMVDFDVIIGTDWLVSCYAMVDCRTQVVRFKFFGRASPGMEG